MIPQQDRVLEHAQREIFFTWPGLIRPIRLPLYRGKSFFVIENHRLAAPRHHAGGGGREVSASRASLIDLILRRIFGYSHQLGDEESEYCKSSRVSLLMPPRFLVAANSIRAATSTSCFCHPPSSDRTPLRESLQQAVGRLLFYGTSDKVEPRLVRREAAAQANG